MKRIVVTALACGLTGLLLAQPASASGHGRGGYGGYGGHGGHRTQFGFYFGGPMYDPWYRPFPPPMYYDYQPRTVIIEREPPVYIQREPAPAPLQPQVQAAAPTWYYCTSPAGYYPHVPRCNQQWVPVDPSTLPPR